MANTAGRSTATTLVIPLRRGWSIWCRLLFAVAKRTRFVTAPLERQSFIHVAHWSLVKRLGGSSLGGTALYFESNFDGSMSDYVDVFLEAVPWRMRSVWAGGIGYPGLHPSDRYQEWSLAHANEIEHYYCGYQEATTTDVAAAVEVDDRLGPLIAAAPSMTEDEFASGFRDLLAEVGPWL